MPITQNPFPQFFDTDGKPLTDGRVYFGVAGQNPRTSPVAIYTDAAGTQPIAQPVRTLGGYPVRNGAPVNIFTPSTYSVAVYTSTGKLVAYAPDSSSFDSVLSATTAFTRGLLDDPDAATARTTLGAVGLTGDETVAGIKTFSSSPVLPGNASAALQAVPKQQAESIAAAVRSTLASLTVTVNANAMTATLQPETLDFRSATLASGTPVSRSATVAASLTVPSAATLGTVNGQAARIVWGWLDNAGTLEPFVANLAGGLNLDETTLISTTAISGTANSAGVAYSQTARTNVAFRVRGFCDVTQATAGTWATGPSLVQGVGGMALAALSSLGYGQTWQNVTGSRAYGTTYYNTRGKPISVSTWSNAGSPGFLTAVVGGVAVDFSQSTSTGTSQNNRVSFIVPPGASYVVNNSGAATLAGWSEMY